MNILIIEPTAYGHHFYYLVWTAQVFLKAGHKVLIGTSEEYSSHTLLLELQTEFLEQVRIITIPSKNILQKFIIRETQNWLWYKSIYEQVISDHQIDYIFIPYLDSFLYALSYLSSPFGKTPFSGIIMTQSFHHKECGILRPTNKKDMFERVLFRTCFKNPYLKSALTIDPYLCQSSYYNNKLTYIPDPSPELSLIEQDNARKKLSLPANKKIILIFGYISSRKGISYLLEAVKYYDLDVQVVMAGYHDQATLELMHSQTAKHLLQYDKLRSINAFISSELETAYYCAADIIWLGYKNHFCMSNVLVKAAACDKDILACREGLIGSLTELYNLGISINIEEPQELADALNKLLKEDISFDKSLRKTFAQEHEIRHFQQLCIESVMRDFEK